VWSQLPGKVVSGLVIEVIISVAFAVVAVLTVTVAVVAVVSGVRVVVLIGGLTPGVSGVRVVVLVVAVFVSFDASVPDRLEVSDVLVVVAVDVGVVAVSDVVDDGCVDIVDVVISTHEPFVVATIFLAKLEMLADAQRDGRPAEYRRRPLRQFRNSIPCTTPQIMTGACSLSACINAANIGERKSWT